ncbi:MAG: ribbon-helix-helix protein, CopG family [Dehalococcoidia bacterium]
MLIRTQISLTRRQKDLLDSSSKNLGLSLSELVRRAIDARYDTDRDKERDLARINSAFGAWKDRDFDGETYVERIRSGRRLSEAFERPD